MKVGFTGTQKGMNPNQIAYLREFFEAHSENIEEFHHGDCKGADEQAHEIAREFNVTVHVHPPESSVKRAFVQDALVTYPPLPYLERNSEIVRRTHVLIAAPAERREILRSGTWSTVRRARATARAVHYALP